MQAEQVEELFHEVADLPAASRFGYFRRRGVRETVRKEVEELLNFDTTSAGSFANDIGVTAREALCRLEETGQRCGPYLLTRLIGRGGMGAVYLAERADGQANSKFAIKLLRPGADDDAHKQRFLIERQILGTLFHPNIAKLLDAGYRENGQPYIVMEYVEGSAIDTRAEFLGVRAKVMLFLKVCKAIGYLHRNLIVHRDLKPANILVTWGGEPKLLDFGLARMLHISTEASETSWRMLTPDYASPEQVLGGMVTTATDIYSAGAVLYKLLTGVTPHRFPANGAESIASVIASGRIELPARLRPDIGYDLESIVMKALRKEPGLRYATIEQFSGDLESYLAGSQWPRC